MTRAPMGTGTAAGGRGANLVYLRSAGLVVLAGTLWSTGGVLVKLVEAADAVQIVLYRSLFVIPVVAGFMAARGRDAVLASLRRVGWSGVLGGFLLAGAFITFVTALTVTTVANAAFVLGATPLVAALLGRFVLGEPVRPLTWAAMAAAALGVAVIAAPGLGPGRAAGTLLALASCACFALFSVLLRRARSQDGTPWLLLGAVFAALAGALFLALGRGPDGLAISGRDLLACAAMGVLQIGCGLIAFTVGARHLPAADLVLLAQTEVVLAPVWAWLVVGEAPAFWTLAGGATVLGAVTVQAIAGTRRLVPLQPTA